MSVSRDKTLYVSDLDGTLLNRDGQLSDFSREQLKILLEQGLQFTVASARTWSEIHPLLGELPFSLPVIAVNGAFLTEYHSGKPLVINHMSAEMTVQVYEDILQVGLLPFVCAYNGQREKLYYQELINSEMQWFIDILLINSRDRLEHLDQLTDALDQQVVSFAVMGPKENVDELAVMMTDKYPGLLENFHFENPYSPGHWWLTIHDVAACKSKAIRELVELYGFNLENVVVFGDHVNDIRMFETAGKAVAVSNAEEPVKAVADEIIGTNEEDAVVKFLTEELRG